MKITHPFRTLLAMVIAVCTLTAGTAQAQSFTTLYNFTGGSDGAVPVARLILSGNTVYGTAEQGGSSDKGTVFAVNTDGTGFTVLHDFSGGGDGAYPDGDLVLSGNTLYGTARQGGSSGSGTVFAVNTDGTGFTILHDFTAVSPAPDLLNGDGAFPKAGLILSGNTLYGTAVSGGSSGFGTVFAVDTSGTGFTTLYSFTGQSDGASPAGDLVLSGNILYGTAYTGGSTETGTVFALNTDGTGFTTLHEFTYSGSDGGQPVAGLILSGNTLYGTAASGTGSGWGTVFSVNTDGTGFATLHDFIYGIDGGQPADSLVLSGNTLYGTAFLGGSSEKGTVFAVNTDGTGFTTLHELLGYPSEGSGPWAGLILSGNTLYGTATEDGSSHYGTVFSLSLLRQQTTMTALSSSSNPSVFGQLVTFTATVTIAGPGAGTPTGTVTFQDGAMALGMGKLEDSGMASFSASALIGSHSITATYNEDGNFSSSTSSALVQDVNPSDTATALGSSANPSVFGQAVTFTATVTPVAPGAGTPTGTVTFQDGAMALGMGKLEDSGMASFSTSALIGSHSITAMYNGDGNFSSSTSSALVQDVNPSDTATALGSSANPSVFGQAVTLTATVTPVSPGAGTPTGTVTFLDGAMALGMGKLEDSGMASFSTSALIGSHSIGVMFNGDGNFSSSTSSALIQGVNPSDTTTGLSSSANPSVFGQTVTLTATVTPVSPGAGMPTGTVTFLDGAMALGMGKLEDSGMASFSTSALIGSHSIGAMFNGDGNFSSSTSSALIQGVNPSDTTTALGSSANPSVFGQAVTFTATVTPLAPGAGTPTGTITFLDGETALGMGTLKDSGMATFSASAPSVGSHSITAMYNGDGNFGSNTSSALIQMVVVGQCVPAPPDMVLWLPFDETRGTISANLVPGGNNGTQVNGPVVTSGFVANSLTFNGVDQYVEVPSYDAINFGTNDFSIDAWIKRATGDTGDSVRNIVDKRTEGAVYTGFAFYLAGSQGTLGFHLADGGDYTPYASSLAVPNDGQWHHVAVTVDRDNTSGLVFYLDGVADSELGNPVVRPGSVSTPTPLRVGSRSSALGFLFSGSIDEVELFNRVLTPAEIATMFNAGSAGKCKAPCVPAPPDMVLWLPFDETRGTISANLVPGGNNGTLVNGPVVTSGFVANSLTFNGVDQYVEVPSYDAINFGTNDFSIDAWINRATDDTGDSVRIIVDKRTEGAVYTGFAFYLAGSQGTLGFHLADGGDYTPYASSLAVPNDGQWHHVAVTVDRDNTSGLVFYLDGVADSVPGNPLARPGSVSTSAPLRVGSRSSALGFLFSGSIDEVDLFSRVLTPGEIATMFNAGSAGKCKAPCAVPLVVNCAPNKTVDCGTDWKFDPPTVTGADVTITSAGLVTNGVCPKSITQTWLMTAACGNSATCSQTVTVVDTESPVITCPTTPIIVALDKGCQLVIPTIHPDASDNCTPRSQLVYTQDPAAGTIVPGPCQLVTVTVRDACDHTSECQVQVCGQGKTPPTLNYPEAVRVTDCFVPNVLALVSAFDNCTAPNKLIFTQSPPAGTLMAAGGNQVSVTVTDPNGNATTAVIHLTSSESFLNVLFNTGVDDNKAVLPGGSVDPHYTLGNVSAFTPTGPGFYNAPNAVSVLGQFGPFGPPPYTRSSGIAPYATPVSSEILYTCTNQFVLPPGADPLTASISGRWSVVEGGKIYLNGLAPSDQISSIAPWSILSGFSPPPPSEYWTYFTANSGFLGFPATNTLYFVVTNKSGGGDFMGAALRAEFTDAAVNCTTCTPPAIIQKPLDQALPLNSTAVFSVSTWGTPPLALQWYHNGLPLSNGGHYSGANTPALTISPLGYADAGTYYAAVSNSCGKTSSVPARLTITKGWGPWPWAWWNFSQIENPLAAVFGPPLTVDGTNIFGLSFGTTQEFNVPGIGGQSANVMEANTYSGATTVNSGVQLQLPFFAPDGSDSVSNYTLIMDILVPSDSTAPVTLFNLVNEHGAGGRDSLSLLTDNTAVAGVTGLSLDGSIDGTSFHLDSSMSLQSKDWNRVALVVEKTFLDGNASLILSLYVNGQPGGSTSITKIGAGTLDFSSTSQAPKFGSPFIPSGPIYVSSIAFFSGDAMSSETVATFGSPDNGPIPVNDPSGDMTPAVLSVTLLKGMVEITWEDSGNDDAVLEETSDLAGGVWAKSVLPFTQMEMNGNILTTAYADPSLEGRNKYYRKHDYKGIVTLLR